VAKIAIFRAEDHHMHVNCNTLSALRWSDPILLAFVLLLSTPAVAEDPATVVHQLCIYEIFDENKQAFHERFRDHALRIMAGYDFNIVAMWESKSGDRTEFVYLLEWPDEKTMEDRWEKFMSDQEWSDIKAQTSAVHGQMVGEIQDRTLRLTASSPHRALAN
jgi:hypothetical protein